jgi:iron complex outermembrane receptor protein
LKPEDAKTWSVGLEFKPTGWQGFRVNLNYFNLNYKNQILALRGTPGVLTNPLYAPFRTLNPTAAQVNALLTSGLPINSPINAALVTYIQDGRRQNLGVINTSGYDFDLSQVWQAGAGSLRAGISGAVFNRYTTKVVADAPEADVLGSINFPQRLRMRGEVSFTRDVWNITGFANYVSAYNQTTIAPIVRIEAYRTFDLHVGYDLGRSHSGGLLKGLSLAFDAQNIADQAPPFVNIAGGYDAQSTSPIGRLLAISLRKNW